MLKSEESDKQKSEEVQIFIDSYITIAKQIEDTLQEIIRVNWNRKALDFHNIKKFTPESIPRYQDMEANIILALEHLEYAYFRIQKSLQHYSKVELKDKK